MTEPPLQPSRPDSGAETILLVEDEPAVRRVMVHMLEGRGYCVLNAGSGPEALRVIEREGASVQLVLTDIVLPGGIAGPEVAERARALIPGVKILFASGYTSDIATLRNMLKQGGAYLQKPFTAESLCRKVREVLDADENTLPVVEST